MRRATWHARRTTMAEVEREKSADALEALEALDAPEAGAHAASNGRFHQPQGAVNPPAPTPQGNGRWPRWYGYTAFVLSGGGARGALQAGALRALLEAGIRPDVVVGTSIGAWNGALLARDPTPTGVDTIASAWLTA